MPTPILDSLKRRGELYRIQGRTGERHPLDNASQAAATLTLRLLPNAVPIDATNVTTWMSQQGPDSDMAEVTSQPGLMPPWEVAWIEWDWTSEELLVDSWPIRRAGCLVCSPRTVHQDAIDHAVETWDFDPNDPDAHQWITAPHRLTVLGPFLPWHGQSGAVIGPWGKWDTTMDEEGYLGEELSPDKHELIFTAGRTFTEAMKEDTGKDGDNGRIPVRIAAYIALRTFQFANCQNVELVEVTPELSRQQRRLLERTGQPVNTWKELRIGAIGGKRSAPGERREVQGLVRQHICRGHFRTYTEERKLFGKYAGRFWIPATVKGNPERGKADKGYIVEAPVNG